ncbi:MAG: alpha/beta fold hydrolase [Betaproteobacteria bacterium]
MQRRISAIAASTYRAPAWLPGRHAQTLFPYFVARPHVAYRRERIETPDGDFWDMDWANVPSKDSPTSPLLVVFHGLEGSSASNYARQLMVEAAMRGWRGVVPNFRGCSGEPNRLPRAYHSGDHEEIARMLAALRDRVDPRTPMLVAGISLGGSALLNWLGRAGEKAAATVTAAATASVPLDLMASGIAIDRGFNRVYAWHFLQTLRPKALALAARFPGRLDTQRIARIRSMHDFDDAVTAPLHDFADVDDYWTRGSSKQWLPGVGVPTLVLNARNDPFVPGVSLPAPEAVSSSVQLEQPATGGHAGFLDGRFPGRANWMPQRLTAFLAAALQDNREKLPARELALG